MGRVPRALPWAGESLRLWREAQARRNHLADATTTCCNLSPSPKGFNSSAQGNALGTRPPTHSFALNGRYPICLNLSKVLVQRAVHHFERLRQHYRRGGGF